MTDPNLVHKKLAHIETCVHELRTLARPDAIATDLRERRFVERTLQIAIQACQDVASHIVSDERLGEPRTNQELLDRLVAARWLEPELGARLHKAIAFRNVLVHGYDVVDLGVVHEALVHGLDDLTAFVAQIRAKAPPYTPEP